MKRVLIITYYWPPTGGSGVQRWVKFAEHLPEFGWQPVVYTPENPEQLAVDKSLLADIPPEAEVIKRRITEPYVLARKLFGLGKGDKGEGVNPLNAQNKSLKQKIAVWVRGNLFVPDPRVWWVKPSVRFLKKYLREHPVDAIVTTGPPQSMHLIGLELHRTLGIPWVADFRDPWTQMFYFKHLGLGKMAESMHREMEKEVLDSASAVVAVTPLVQADFAAATSTPVHLVTNGYDEKDFAPVDEPTEGSSTVGSKRQFKIVHTGLFASDGNPVELWEALAELVPEIDLQIILAGKVDREIMDSIKAAGLGERLVLPGYLSHEKSVETLRGADLLILPLRKEPEYRKVLPGKVFEYLAARRPVLGIGQEDGAAAGLLRETRAGLMLDWPRKAEMKDFVQKVYNHDITVQGCGIEQYSRRNLTKKMVDILERL